MSKKKISKKKQKSVKELFQSIIKKIQFCKNKNKILSMYPRVIEGEHITEYLHKIHAAIKDKYVYNISITGNYGTGKSSIIRSYLYKYFRFKRKYIMINIASYFDYEEINEMQEQTENQNNTSAESYSNELQSQTLNSIKKDSNNFRKLDKNEIKLVNNIEEAILRQILFRNSSEYLPNSEIRRVDRKLHQTFNLGTILYVIYYLLIIFIISSPITEQWIKSFIELLPKMKSSTSNIIMLILGIAFIISLFNVIYMTVSMLYYGSKSLKIKVSGNEFTFNTKNTLAFAKNLREIILFFAYNRRYSLVIFEDIDRFPEDVTLKLVEELKQLNNIINNSESVRQRVKFVYSFKDGIFSKVEDKSKFYDYNISIMPVSTFYNSKDILNQLFQEANIKQEPNEKLKDILTDYIIDVRTYITIVNDYDIFSRVLIPNNNVKGNDINPDKIFAMSIIKNVKFKDYESILQHNNFIDQKFDIIAKNRKTTTDNLNLKIEKAIDKVYNSYQLAMNELKDYKKSFWKKCIDDTNPSTVMLHDIETGEYYNYQAFLDDDFKLNLLKEDKLDIEDEITIDYTAIGGKEQFFNKIDYITKDYLINKKELDNLEEELDEIKNISDGDYSKKYLKFQSVDDDILDKLIVENFIEKDYIDYITLPSTSGLTSRENKFIFEVKHQIYDFEAPIINDKAVTKILDNYFDTPYILNIFILNYIKNDKKFEQLVLQFSEMTKEKYEFLKVLKSKNTELYKTLIEEILKSKIDIWKDVDKKDNTCEEKKVVFEGIMSIKNGVEFVQNKDSIISYANFYFNRPDIIVEENILLNKEVQTNIEQFMKYKIRIKNISNLNKEIQEIIIKLRIYQYNQKNIETIYNRPTTSLYPVSIKFLGYLLEEIRPSIIENFQLFYDEYYKYSKIKIDDPDTILLILKSNISLEVKREIYNRETFRLNILDLDENLYKEALENDHIIVNWDNIITLCNNFFDEKEILSKWFIKNEKELFSINQLKENQKKICNLDEEILKMFFFRFVSLLDDDPERIEATNMYNYIFSKKRFQQDAIGKLKSFNTIKKLCEWNLLGFKKSTLQRIMQKDIKLARIYLLNWSKERDVSVLQIYTKVKNIKNAVELLLEINEIKAEEKIKIIIKEASSRQRVANLLISSFQPSIIYEINYKKSYVRDLFENKSLTKLFKSYKIKDKSILFSIF